MKALLEFDDAGAADDEPVKGVTVGDIRAWHDHVDALEAALCRIRDDGKNCVDHCRRQAGRALARAALDKADKAG